MEMLINSKHISTEERMEVTNPYDNSIVDTIPVADEKIVHDAIKSAKNSKNKMTNLSSREIYYRLTEACTELKEQKEDIAKIITKETGKPINGSLYELDRSIETLMFAAEESKRVYGENVPIDAGLGGEV